MKRAFRRAILLDDYGDRLICLRCGEEHLHHGTVTVFGRREDEDDVTIIEVKDQIAHSCVIANAGSGNPSVRRDGITIEFWCEQCDGISELCIAQHKGWSMVEWRAPVREVAAQENVAD